MSNAEISAIGLLLDIIGVLLLWRFGLPPKLRRGGVSFFVLEQKDENEAKKARLYDRIAHVAIFLIVLGFALQAFGTGVLSNASARSPASVQPTPQVDRAPIAPARKP